ncbi:Stp1/IreP family PP2C-type Ser/Thr phosphatase [Alkalibacillus aidingensis]|uniref:Stp1/IreP family PP2C-type Ser/Thr phosphatase n=1 Tax=Alkalibacillus aidingensis TaxID=2747607 RepID=UPI00166110DC|nr:Stp1/IreP family PP2C-type Ser/Thr phosphatase [Alkalibacillus aidingensis]
MHAVFKTDKGKIREANEDAGGIFYNVDGQLLAVVADGMGGHQAGDVASRLAVEHLREEWEHMNQFTDVNELKDWLENVITDTNEVLKQHAEIHQECAGMGTTLIAASVIDQQVIAGHIGDSRLYHIHDGEIDQKTDDHSFVNELVLQGHITKEEAESHPRKNVLTRALGTENEVTVDTLSFDWEDHSYCLLCTDGLTNKLSDSELLDRLIEEESMENKVDNLLNEANQRGGEDNITVALIQLSHDEEGDSSWS